MNAFIAAFSPQYPDFWSSPALLYRCLAAILLFGVVAALVDSGEPEDPTDF